MWKTSESLGIKAPETDLWMQPENKGHNLSLGLHSKFSCEAETVANILVSKLYTDET